MDLSLLYFTSFLCILLSTAGSTELSADTCPTSRRLLFLNGFPFTLGEKKPEHVSSSSKSSSSSKNARSDQSHSLTVYIQPQTSNELGQKVRSYSHLLKSKLFTKEERARLKQLQSEKKKPSKHKPPTTTTKKNKNKSTEDKAPKTRDLVAVNDQERDRCRALLHLDQENSLIPIKDIKPSKKKKSLTSKVKNATSQAKKKLAAKAKSLLLDNQKKSKKASASKSNSKPAHSNDKKKKPSSETPSFTPLETDMNPGKRHTPPPPPPPPPTTPRAPPTIKVKREKAPPVIDLPSETPDHVDSFDGDDDDKNNSVVGRAYHFVKNMFQLSDDILENNHTHDDDPIVITTNEQQHRQSRKLLSLDESEHAQTLGIPSAHISRRQLLTAKGSKHAAPAKEKKASSDANKPKVGWNYRYRISRYLSEHKTKRSGSGKVKQGHKKTSSAADTKNPKRKLLELNNLNQFSSDDDEETSDEEIVNSVLVVEDFVPKRQLLASKKVNKVKVKIQEEEQEKVEEDDDDEEDGADGEKTSERRRIKSLEALTDPVEIVRSYDRGLFKPRVGWQFRYRVSRYIDSLRENIREDQHRLKLGLQAIKRKTPQELSGRRKRVLDKPFESETEQTATLTDENKPNVGWRYRYRISKMLEAKRRGDYVDDEEEKRQARLGQKQKGAGKAHPADDECVEWEYDLDPELRKIGEEGKRVGWAYRYRIRRKLDELKQKQAKTGIPFDFETLGGKRDKKTVTSTVSPTVKSEDESTQGNKNVVGWKYRYRVSKMREAQKHDAVEKAKVSPTKKYDHVPPHERLDPALARLTPEERVVGWQYRYRIRRKLDALKGAARESEGGLRGKHGKQSKRKQKEKIIKQVEESIEKILNIDDIDETPFMEYFRRSSSYVFSGLLPTARKSVCLLPLPVTLSFCREGGDEKIKKTPPISESPKQPAVKKLRTKKEKTAKQFIQSHSTKLDTIDEKIEEPVKPVSKAPTVTIDKPSKKPSRPRPRPTARRSTDEQARHFDEEEQPVKKLIGVESKKKNKKKFQIIGQEKKVKHRNAPLPSTTPAPPVSTTTPSTPPATPATPTLKTTPVVPATTTPAPPVTTPTATRATIVVTTRPPVVEVPKTTPPPPPPPQPPKPAVVPITTTTTTPAPLRSIPELIEEEEATTILSTKAATAEELKEEINEANESLQSTTTTTTIPPPATTSSSSSTDDSDSTSTDSESDSDDGTSTSTDSESSSSSEDYDPAPMQKIKQLYESTKESVHDAFDSKNEKE